MKTLELMLGNTGIAVEKFAGALYLKLGKYEVMAERVGYVGFSYARESEAEREVHLGKVRVTISG